MNAPERVSADHEKITMPDGEVVSNKPDGASGDSASGEQADVVYARHTSEFSS